MKISTLLDRVPPWISTNIRSPQSWKLLARCWLASWTAFVLILPNKSLAALGNAAFFCCIASFIVPPFLPVQMFFFAMATMLVGCLLGWGLGSAAMRAALAARSEVLLHFAIEKAEQTAEGAANPDAVISLQVFQGAFLDVRSSVIFGVFLALGAFFFALIRAYTPKLALFSVFGTVFLDVICSYGPLFPASQYLILNSFFISTTSYVAIGCVVIFLVFPETLNHQYLNSTSGLLATIRKLMEVQDRVLRITSPTEILPESPIPQEIQANIAAMVGGIQKLDSQSGMLGLEFTFGRFNGDDAQAIEEPLKVVVSRIAGLQTFSRFIGGEAVVGSSAETNSPSTTDVLSDEPHLAHQGDTYLLSHLRAAHRQQELERRLRPQDILPILNSATLDLRTACVNALTVAEHLIIRVNRQRWQPKLVEPEPNLDDRITELRKALGNFKTHRRLEIVEPFNGLGGSRHPYRTLYMALVFEANLIWSADAMISMLEVLATLAGKRKKARVWAPKGLRAVWKVLRRSDESDRRALGEDEPPASTKVTEKNGDTSYRRDPDSSPPTYALQYIGDASYRVYRWCKTPKAIYAFKYTFVSVALWLPSVFPRSAYFNYTNKGLWALIMAQTTLEPYIADQIYSYVARLTATTAGILIGLVLWYIGAANGNGNPFGIAAVMAVILVPLMFWRLFGPSPVPAIMCAVTVVLVVGYSWLDAHLTTLGNPGVGWPVAWRRWVLVIIGSGASFLLMLMPPKSGRRAVRQSHATLIFEISQLYSQLISRWLAVEEGDESPSPSPLTPEVSPSAPQNGKDAGETRPQQDMDVEKQQDKQDTPAWGAMFRAEIGEVWSTAQRLRLQTQTAKWEGNIRGAWPSKTYFELLDVETEMLANLAQLAGALLHLDPAWRVRLLHRSKVLNPNLITDVIAVFSLVSQSLRTGEPLHEVIPRNLVDRVFYHHTLLPAEDPNILDPNMLDGARKQPESELDQFRSEEFMSYATGVAAVFKILTLLDELHRITKTLCGEVPMKGFQEWRDTFERRAGGELK